MSRDPEQTICFCHNVNYETLVQAIRGGAKCLKDIKEKTQASTGCSGCESDVSEILIEEGHSGE
jgi:NAD(P)H-nitrite reductase large subunit